MYYIRVPYFRKPPYLCMGVVWSLQHTVDAAVRTSMSKNVYDNDTGVFSHGSTERDPLYISVVIPPLLVVSN